MMAGAVNNTSYMGLRTGFFNSVPKRSMAGVRPPEPLPGNRQPSSRDLPVRRQKNRIVEKVQENRVTLIYATTGSGKSSQVPQMLLDEGLGPILCTQPRRLAVVAVAKRVAEERGCALGEDVGYQIGQLNLSTTRTKIVFKTAGILFEELRTNGTAALSRFKVLILDEVHERSVESDLVLTCVKQLLRSTNIKLVLMSATADFQRYEEYFKDIDRVEKIAIDNIGEKFQSLILNTKVVYLEQVVKLLGTPPDHTTLLDSMNLNFAPAEKGVDMGNPTQNVIRDLIVHLHESEPDLSKNVLVFLPTYRALEQQWLLLNNTRKPFQVYVLHRSIDIEQSIRAMEACPLHQRKIILATNVAESSITISGVSFVIDACRSLEVYWDGSSKREQTRLVWVSKAQADQRKGRTGRTCDGTVYRLIPRNHWVRFQGFETPAIQLLSLRKQVLMIICATSKALNDPQALLKKCMNAPSPDTVDDALDTLEDMNAMNTDVKGKHQATLYGQLLVSLPLSLEASVLVVRGGQLGYPRESAVLAAISHSTPNPIVKPFGNFYQYQLNVESYYKPANKEEGQGQLAHSTIMLANLNAYEFWQRTFKDKCRLDSLVQQAKFSRLHINKSQKSDQGALELDWCTHHSLSLTSLRSVCETVDIIMEALHKFRPEFLCKISGPPSYVVADNFQHSCSSQEANGDASHDGWNDPSFQESGNKYNYENNHNGNGVGFSDHHEDGSDPWDDWSFQESEKKLNGQGEVNGSDERNSNGQALNGNEKTANGQVDASTSKVNGSHHSNGDGEANGNAESSHTAKPQRSDAHDDPETCPSLPYTQSGTFRSPEDEQVLCALIVEAQQGTPQPIISEFVGETLGEQLFSSRPLCSYFRKGICNKGALCLYSHSPSAILARCKYYDAPGGCRYGDACRYLHPTPKYVLPSDTEPPNFDEPDPTPQSMLNLLPVVNENEYLLLFGEGDFSFAEALSRFVDPKKIFATSLDKEEVFLQEPLLKQRLMRLARLEMQLRWNVDVTSLMTSSENGKRRVHSIPWRRVRCVLWNFPFADVDENAAKHQDLMLRFFASLSVMMFSSNVHSVPVIITLCNDQYCRWKVERAARDSFFFLRTSVPFDVPTFGGYCPMRNNLQSSFPVQRPLIYMFDFIPPMNVEGVLSEDFGGLFR
ncbi:unnamed protein product [Calypogeia fissa]